MRFWPSPSDIQRARAIPLERVLQLHGARPDPRDRRKWHTAQGVLSITRTQFMNWTLGVGGGGAIDLVMHLQQRDFRTALDWLQRQGPGARSAASLPPATSRLILPAPDPAQLARVHRYLVRVRALPAALVDGLIQSGRLYADHRANAVFLLFPISTASPTHLQPNASVGAELRGTSVRPWRGLAPGSRKDRGCFGWPDTSLAGPAAGRPVILCESAIDALSCWALHPRHRCLSTAGARPNPAWLVLLLQHGCPVYCGFDADPVGDRMAQAMMARYPKLKRLRPSAHDWNDLLKRALPSPGLQPVHASGPSLD